MKTCLAGKKLNFFPGRVKFFQGVVFWRIIVWRAAYYSRRDEKLIDSMPAKSSPIDSIPTSIIKSFSDVFALLIARLATLSFRNGSFPSSYKTASVTPLLKKNVLDRDNPANFRPILNLHTISKILERLFLSRFTAHVENSPNFNRFQSAYRRGFSTETAILRLLSDVRCAADEKCRSMVVLLDLSAAFDTIDIDTLLRRLEHTFGITGSALLWLRTYLEGRSQYVRIGDNQSTILPCEFGVLRVPFSDQSYSPPTSHRSLVSSRHLASIMPNMPMTRSFTSSFVTTTRCSRWAAASGRSTDCSRRTALHSTRTNPKWSFSARMPGIDERGEIGMTTLGDAQIPVSKTEKSLGITLNDKLSFNTHVDNACKAAHFQIRALRHIRGCIDEETACMVASSMVGSRLDYCNSVLHGTSAENLGKLQRVLHALARVVTGTRRSDHITPVLARLHWLPVAHGLHSRSHSWPSRRSRRKNLNISLRCYTSKPRQGYFDSPQETVCMWMLSELFSPVTLSVMPHPQSGTISDSPEWPVFNTRVFQKTT